jgi:hypothetical protein
MGAAIVPNLDSIDEFRILTNNFDAEYGEFSGGQINVVTKSGTQRISRRRFRIPAQHGSGRAQLFFADARRIQAEPVRRNLRRSNPQETRSFSLATIRERDRPGRGHGPDSGALNSRPYRAATSLTDSANSSSVSPARTAEWTQSEVASTVSGPRTWPGRYSRRNWGIQ